jgi:hypothetical protein
MLVGWTDGDIRVVREAPAVRQHPEKPRRVYFGLIEDDATGDASAVLHAANLATKRPDCLSAFCEKKHAAALTAIERKTISAIQRVAHLNPPRLFRARMPG